ncbi:lytic transglycosylase domain-containing protein [Altererythrobacter sp. MTPC7]|uniref:lytic transglycosylase domain-containing protein n=1 Tax=Altererythrobacter sp. MTPC7 TaxID=3056567 RepID=UPI0036F32DFB
MTRIPLYAATLAATTALFTPAQAAAQNAAGWDSARASLVAQQPTRMADAVNRWEYLIGQRDLSFDQYAGFLLTYPDFPQAETLQERAENALDNATPTPQQLVAFFNALPPITNSARARYALALATLNRPEAFDVARAAWRGGDMSGPAEAYMMGLFAGRFTPDDHDARMNALLWQRDGEAAARQIAYVTPMRRDGFAARLATLQGQSPMAAGYGASGNLRADPGYVYNMSRYHRIDGRTSSAVDVLVNRPNFSSVPHDSETMISEMLRVAREASAGDTVRIAQKVDDVFAADTDVSKESYRTRDDYTSLMWAGGTNALWRMGDGRTAAPLFYRYGAAAQTPQTRSKGFYWAGLASQRAGDMAEATRYYEMAARYPERFYGQLALAQLGRGVPSLAAQPTAQPTAEQRDAFNRSALANAVREVARGAPWRTGIRFYQEVAQSADTPEEHVLVSELARETGRRDLAVNVTEAAGADGLPDFVAQGFPTLQTPPGSNWTFVHAIARQESQFAQNAISHAGARGLMQLMPGTAREQAGMLGMSYRQDDLINSPSYNVQLGNAYFARMMSYYDGSYPLAIAAYNAGPGNVNKWLRANGDPRNGSVDWLTWIERIPIFETKNYVQRVIENAAVYEHLYPDRAEFGRARMANEFLR